MRDKANTQELVETTGEKNGRMSFEKCMESKETVRGGNALQMQGLRKQTDKLEQVWQSKECQETSEVRWRATVCASLLQAYALDKQYVEARDLYRQYVERHAEDCANDILIHCIMADVYFEEKQYVQAKEHLNAYQKLICRYQRQELFDQDMLSATIEKTKENVMMEMHLKDIFCQMECGDIEKAQTCLQAVDIKRIKPKDSLQVFKLYIQCHLRIAFVTQNWNRFIECYQLVLTVGEPCVTQFPIWFEAQFPMHNRQWQAVYQAVASMEGDESFQILCRLRTTDESEQDMICALLDCLQAQNTLAHMPEYPDVLYHALRMNHGMQQMMEDITIQELAPLVQKLGEAYRDFPLILDQWIQRCDSNNQTLQQLRWVCELMFQTLVQDDTETKRAMQDVMPQKTAGSLFRQLVAATMQLCERLYQPDMMLEEKCGVLPEVYQMAFYVSKALWHKKQGQLAEYACYLKKAAQSFPPLHHSISQLAEELRVQLQETEQANQEFALLAQQVKEQTTVMIAQGNLLQAEEILHTYHTINPTDEEAVYMLQMLKTQKNSMIQ